MKRLIVIFLCFAQSAFAAISANAVWDFRDTATGTAGKNGGFFVTGASGTDYSKQNGAQYALTIASSAGAGNVVTHASAAADMVGNGVFVVSGTNFTLNSWFEITSVSVGVSFTCSTNAAGASISTGVGVADGVMNIGGANLLNSTLADEIFEAGTAGNIYYFKTGSYTLGEAISIAIAGTTVPFTMQGYTTTQGDACTGSSRPTIAAAALGFTYGANWNGTNLIFTGTTAPLLAMGTGGKLKNVKATNSSTTAAREAIRGNTDFWVMDCEAVSYRGKGFGTNGSSGTITSCWLHDSDAGLADSGSTNVTTILNNIIESNVTAAIQFTGAHTGRAVIYGNTLFGSTNTTGIGVSIATGGTDIALANNIITGFVTGVNHADVQSIGYDNYNDYQNNDTDVTNWTKGANDSAVAPSFTSVGQVTGTNATISTLTLTSSGADFTAAGVVAGRDYLYLISGTAGPTFGIYGIAAVGTTTLTLDIAPGNSATADHVYQITIGHNFAIGSAMKALGYPGAFQGGYSTGYIDQGAVQRQEPSASGQKGFSF